MKRRYRLMVNTLAFLNIHWCDWCDTLCVKPYTTEHDEDVCKSCKDDSSWCECCEEIVHPNLSVDMPEGGYCQDCYDDIFG